MKNDPLGGHTKGCLLEPREQTEDERLAAKGCGIGQGPDEITLNQLRIAVEKLNKSLAKPLTWEAFNGRIVL
jgi:hypothetical protein